MALNGAYVVSTCTSTAPCNFYWGIKLRSFPKMFDHFSKFSQVVYDSNEKQRETEQRCFLVLMTARFRFIDDGTKPFYPLTAKAKRTKLIL